MTLIILIYFTCGRLSFTVNKSIYFLVYILVKPLSVGQKFLGIAPRATQEVNVEWYYNAGLEFVFLLWFVKVIYRMSKNVCLFSQGKTYQKSIFPLLQRKLILRVLQHAICMFRVPCPGFRIMIKKGFVKMSPASEY